MPLDSRILINAFYKDLHIYSSHPPNETGIDAILTA